MKKILVFLLIVGVAVCLAACAADGGSKEITTSRSGKISASLYDQTTPENKKDKSAKLTPLVRTSDKKITDDAKGLFLVSVAKSGEGTVALSKDKAEAGATVTINATPATDWKVAQILVDGTALAEGTNTFVMPSKDATVNVVFADKRHVVTLGDHIVVNGWGERLADYYSPAYTVVEGQRYLFTVDFQDENRYYEDADVTCRLHDETQITVTKVGDGRYEFIAPDADCGVWVETHEYRKIDAVTVYDTPAPGANGIEITNDCSVSVSVNGAPYTPGDNIKENATVSVCVTAPFDFDLVGLYSWWSFAEFGGSVTDNVATFPASSSSVRNGQSLHVDVRRYYNVDCAQTQNGSLEVQIEKARRLDTVTVTVTPDNEYQLESLAYTTDGENFYDIGKENDVYCFLMPDGDVTITATFKAWEWYDWTVIGADNWGSEGDYLKEWTLTGSLSGEHKNQMVSSLVKGERIEFSATALDGRKINYVTYSTGNRWLTNDYNDAQTYSKTFGTGLEETPGAGIVIKLETREQ